MIKPLNILLAEDDNDDLMLFNEVLSELPLATSLTSVSDGENLKKQLSEKT